MKKYKCPNCNVKRTSAFPMSDETGDTYCPDCNYTFGSPDTNCDICGMGEEDLATSSAWCSRCHIRHNLCGMCLEDGHGLDEIKGETEKFDGYRFSGIKKI